MIMSSMVLLLVLLLGCGLPLFLCQSEPALPDCQGLGFEAVTMSLSGANLEVCSTDQQQCCTEDYISEVEVVAKTILNNGLNQELNNISSLFSTIIGLIKGHFSDQTFHEGWQSFLPNPGGFFDEQKLSENYDRLIGNFFDDLIINSTSPNSSASELFVRKIIETATNSIGNLLGGGDMSIKDCIVQCLSAKINDSTRSNMTDHLEILRRGITALVNSEQFLMNYSQNDSFKFPTKCANELTSISFCGRCNSTFPPLCSKTCGALIRGCYSPYYDALPKEFYLLWNVSIQVLHVLNTNYLQDLFTEGRRLFNNVSMGELQTCGNISFPPPIVVRNRSAAALFISSSLIQELEDLKGRGLYGSDGSRRPLICQPEGQDCMGRCAISSFCTATSSCRCYNRISAQTTDDDVQMFTNNDVTGQQGNPAVTLNMDELTTTMDSIGQPIRVFLEQLPLIPGVTIPEDTTEATTVPTISGSAIIGATPVLLALGIFFNVMILVTCQMVSQS